MNPLIHSFQKPRRLAIAAVACWLVGTTGLIANDAGGGAPGSGANVTLATTSTTATLSNGVIQAVIEKSTGKVTSYTFNGTQMLDTAGNIYYSMDGGSSYEQPGSCVYSLVTNTTDHIEISCKRTWNAGGGFKHVFDIDLHYVLRRGDTGLYAFAILDHPASYPAASVGEWRIVWKLPHGSTDYTFERAYVDAARNWQMPSYYDYQRALPTGIAEIVKLTTGVRNGLYDCKYSYSARYSEIGTWGHASDTAKKGVWFVLGGHDYFNDGPTKQDLTLAVDYLLMHFGRNHYSGSGTSVAAGEAWRKLYGPFLLYCNGSAVTTNAGNALWADAQAQVAAERAAWPYEWLTTPDHPANAARGTVTGRFLISDVLKPGLTGANANIGLAAPEDTDGNWQNQGKGYQYWTKADASGNFTIPAVRPGSYTLYAFTDGAVGEYSKTAVAVTAGATTALGTQTWTVQRAGASLAWEIGTADRTAKEFKHGTDYFTPYLWDVYPGELANPLTFDIGTDDPATDVNYVHSGYPTVASGGTTWGAWEWKLNFNLASLAPSGQARFTVAVASSNYARLYLRINDDTTDFTRISPAESGGNALLRQGIHAKYSVVQVSIPVSKLRLGANTFTLRQSVSASDAHVMYDYLALEMPPLPPPPPSSGRTLAWNGGGTAAANTWDNGSTASFITGTTARSFGTGDKVTVDDNGSNSTSLTLTGSLEPEQLTFANNAKNFTLAGTGALIGQMSLIKNGTGQVTLSSANAFAGPTVLNSGTLTFGNDAANNTALGTSAIKLNGGTLSMFYSSTAVTVTGPWNLEVPAGATATFRPAWRASLTGKLIGNGTLNYVLPNGSIRADLLGDWSGFSGQINASAVSGSAAFRMASDYAWSGLAGGALNLGANITAYYSGNLNTGNGTFVDIGEISGVASATLRGGAITGRQITYRIGGRGTDATFAGNIGEQTNGLTHIVKTGPGVWTLSGTCTHTGGTTVSQGTLRLTGSLTNASTMEVAADATLNITGTLTTTSTHVAEGGTLIGPGTLVTTLVNDGLASAASGTLMLQGNVTNNGVMRLSNNAALICSGTFTNNGVLDLIDSTTALPAGFVNNGLVLRPRAAASLVWSGSTSTAWDTFTSVNWLNAAVPDVFRSGDAVTFDDNSAITDVELKGTLQPSAVIVNNSTNTFVFGGTGMITGPATFTKSGSGLVSIATSQPLTGNVLISAGTVQLGLSGSFPSSPQIEIASGGTLDVSNVSNGFRIEAAQSLRGSGAIVGATQVLGTLSPGSGVGTLNVTGSLTLGSTAQSNFTLGTASDRVAVTGNVTLGGVVNVTADAGFAAGAYPLFSYTGTLSVGSGLSLGSMPAGFDYALDVVTPGQVRLIVSITPLTAFQRWAIQYFGDYTLPAAAAIADPDGDGQTNADEFVAGTIPTSAASVATLSWRGNGTSNLWDASATATFWNGARASTFTNGNPVVFDASGSVQPIVNVTGTVSPGSIVVSGGNNYTFTGTGSVAGAASLGKSGAGTLTLNTANSFTGGVVIDAGIIVLGNAAALGTGTITLNGGTLATAALTPTNAIHVTADSSISGGSSGGLQGIKAVGGSNTLTLIADNVFDLEGSLSGFTGRIVLSGTSSFRLNGGSLSTTAAFDLGNRSLSARSGTAFSIGSLEGASTAQLAGASGSGNTSNVTYTIGGNNNSTTYAGTIVNGGGIISLTKMGAGALTLTGNHTYTGTTTVSAGLLALSGSLTGPLNVNSGTFAPEGMPTIGGAFTVNAGGTFQARINGTTAGTQYDQLGAGGSVTLSGPLNLVAGPGLVAGTSFKILNKTSVGAISGTFAGKPEGSAFTDDGYTWIISYLGGDGNDVALTLATPSQSWRFTYFGTLSNSGTAADTFDANGDGEPNLLEYATAQNPTAASRVALAVSRTASAMEIIYTRSKAALNGGVDFAVEWSDTLAPNSWSSTGVTQSILSDDGTVQSVVATIPAGPALAKRFARLKVSSPPP